VGYYTYILYVPHCGGPYARGQPPILRALAFAREVERKARQ
jgi:hypothetical protein